MGPAVTALLALLAQLLPSLASSTGTAGIIINALIEIVPVLVQEFQDVLPMVKNIIAVLKNDPATTQAQLDALDALDKQVDDAFEAAAAAAQAEDAANP